MWKPTNYDDAEGNDDAYEVTDYAEKSMWLRMIMRILHKMFEKATNAFPLRLTESTDISIILHLVSSQFPLMLLCIFSRLVIFK